MSSVRDSERTRGADGGSLVGWRRRCRAQAGGLNVGKACGGLGCLDAERAGEGGACLLGFLGVADGEEGEWAGAFAQGAEDVKLAETVHSRAFSCIGVVGVGDDATGEIWT